jgi:hypothetical protein
MSSADVDRSDAQTIREMISEQIYKPLCAPHVTIPQQLIETYVALQESPQIIRTEHSEHFKLGSRDKTVLSLLFEDRSSAENPLEALFKMAPSHRNEWLVLYLKDACVHTQTF